MYYYSYKINDIASITQYMTFNEQGVFHRVLNWMILHERPFPADFEQGAKRLGLHDYKEELQNVLELHFNLIDDGYTLDYVEEQINAYREKSEKATAAINARWKKKDKEKPQSADTDVAKNNTDVIQAKYGSNTDVIPTNNQEPRTNNQEPNKGIPPIPPKGCDAVVNSDFEKLWDCYPKRTAKQKAAAAFKKLRPDKPLVALMLSAVEQQKQSQQWQKNNGEFVPHLATWLNGRRWNDEVMPATGTIEALQTKSEQMAERVRKRVEAREQAL